MSPASQGSLQVERYIGSCLISSMPRPLSKDCKKPAEPGRGYKNYGPEQCQGHYGRSGTWTGTPLISMTSTPRRNGGNQQRSSPSPLGQQQQQQQPPQQLEAHNKNPLLRLAIHTQGVPLILAGRFPNRPKSYNTTGNNGTGKCPKKAQQGPKPECPKDSANSTNIDSLSIASDESSNNSENSLPRIIKPRKRRKKDRKPNVTLGQEPQKCDDPGPVESRVQTCYDGFRGPRRSQIPRDVRSNPNGYRQVKVLDDNLNVIDARQSKNVYQDACQCRFSEPLMWDVDQVYSGHSYLVPQFTHPQPQVFLPRRTLPYPCQDHEFFGPERCGASLLRRSWSDPVSYFGDEFLAPNRDVGVIGDRGQSESRRSSWRGDVACHPIVDANVPSPASSVESGRHGTSSCSGSSQGLEVSTEIVTSPNGHRDLEIKFYSSSKLGIDLRAEDAEDPEEEEAEEDEIEEDLSDIWSYHENKLQQDFRTLLQAEE